MQYPADKIFYGGVTGSCNVFFVFVIFELSIEKKYIYIFFSQYLGCLLIITLVSKQTIICYIYYREQELPEDIYRCHFSLAALYFKSDNMEKALNSLRSALSSAKELNNKSLETDTLLLMAQVLFSHIIVALLLRI